MTDTAKPLTGRKVFIMIFVAFSVIIGVNLTLAFQAVTTFPGLEVKNSYVASQNFDSDRQAQLALNWKVTVQVENGMMQLAFVKNGIPVEPIIRSAIIGRATNVQQDQTPDFSFNGAAYAAPVILEPGYWNLRVLAEAADGTLFRQRIQFVVPQ